MTIKKDKISSLIAALGFFVILGMILPQYDGIKNSREALQLRKDKLKERSELVGKVKKLSEEYEKNTSNIAKLDLLIPENRQEEQVVSSLQAMTNQSGLILQEVGVTELQSSTTGIYKSNIINMRVTGRYPAFVSFLQSLEKNLRLYDVREVTISESSGGSSNSEDLNFQLKITTNSLNKQK